MRDQDFQFYKKEDKATLLGWGRGKREREGADLFVTRFLLFLFLLACSAPQTPPIPCFFLEKTEGRIFYWGDTPYLEEEESGVGWLELGEEEEEASVAR